MTALPPASGFPRDRSPWKLPVIHPFNPLTSPTRPASPTVSGPPVTPPTKAPLTGVEVQRYAEVMQKIHLASVQPMSADCKASLLQSAYREMQNTVSALEESTTPLSPSQIKYLGQCKSLLKSLLRLFRLLLGLDLSEEEIEVLLVQGIRPVAAADGGLSGKDPASREFSKQKGASPMFQNQNQGSQAQSQKDPQKEKQNTLTTTEEEFTEAENTTPANPFLLKSAQKSVGRFRPPYPQAWSPEDLIYIGSRLLKDAQNLPDAQSQLHVLLMAFSCLTVGNVALEPPAAKQ